MTEFDKEIAANDAKCLSLLDGITAVYGGDAHLLMQAIHERKVLFAAKREIERPKLLTAKEAAYLMPWAHSDSVIVRDAYTRLLTEERKRTLAVIEALPRHEVQTMISGPQMVGMDRHNDAVRLPDIRAALQPKS